MSVLIKGIKMPESGYIDIRLHTFADGKKCATMQADGFYKKLDVAEIPTPHGRLIDAVKTFENVELAYGYVAGDEFDNEILNHVLAAIVVTPTVIERE